MKGPDVMAKSKRTQERYARAFRGQGKLTGFGFKAPLYPVRVKGPKTKPEPDQPGVTQPPAQPPVPISDEQREVEPLQTAGLSRMRSALVLSDPSTDGEAAMAAGLDDVDEMDAGPENGNGEAHEVSEADMNEEDIEG